MNDDRPDPERLLARILKAEAPRTQGRRRVFLGAAAGVGKTYAMIEQARLRRGQGIDVAVGWVDTHGRPETEALFEGLEILPARSYEYRGTVLQEFDLDAALARKPQVLLLDELAHSNAPGARHAKRRQDAEELLGAGIDIYTAVNIQHLENLNDIITQTTGVVVRETVPDRFLDDADEIELIDITPEDLLERLKEGKVYVPAQAERAMRGFFTRGNLTALRELALRRVADRVDAELRTYKDDQAIGQVWPVSERLLVCVSASPSAARVSVPPRGWPPVCAPSGSSPTSSVPETPASPRRTGPASPIRFASPSNSGRRPSR
jgi:two-component system sensor histidine kinase KdpD